MALQIRRSMLVRSGMVAAALLCLAACTESKSSDNDTAAIKSAANGLAEAWRTKNTKSVLSFMDENVTVMPPGSPVMHGRSEVAHYVEQVAADPSFSLTMTVDTVGRSENLAYSRGRFVLKYVTPGSNQETTTTGSFVSVFKRGADGHWSVVEDISTPS